MALRGRRTRASPRLIPCQARGHQNAKAWANTLRDEQQRRLNQDLDWHLLNVGQSARTMVQQMAALNLRTLSLQTGDAYAEQLSIPPSQLSTVIGDKLVSQLHAWQKSLQATRSQPERDDHDSLMDDDASIDLANGRRWPAETCAPSCLVWFLSK